MQAFPVLGFELFQRRQTDLKMLAYTLPIEFAGHASELDFTVKGLIRHAEQRSVGHAEAKAVTGDRCRLHVECDSASVRQTADDGGIANSQLRLSTLATVPVRITRFSSKPASPVTSLTACSSAT